MSETSVKIIRCRDDTMPKTVDTRSHCKVRLRACNNLPQPPPYISVFWGCGRLLHALNLTLQWLLVSTVFGMVSSLHLISFLMIFTLVYISPVKWGWCFDRQCLVNSLFTWHKHVSVYILEYISTGKSYIALHMLQMKSVCLHILNIVLLLNGKTPLLTAYQ